MTLSYEGPPPSRHRRPRWLVRNKLGVAAGTAVAFVVAAGGVYLGTGAAQPEPSNAANALEYPPPSTGQAESTGPASSAPATPSVSTTPSTGTTPSTAAAPKAPTTGWVPVDPAAWKAQADAYRALKIDPVPAGVGNLPEFRADCQYSHRLPDDPIVAPGLPGASHMHSFVGNKAVDANTVAGDLTKFTATTCKPVQDHSAYWVPTLYDNATGKPVETTGFRVYYRSLAKNSAGQMPMPNGLRMISGDAKKKKPTPRGATGQFYCAFYGPGDLDGIARSTNGNWPICGGRRDAALHDAVPGLLGRQAPGQPQPQGPRGVRQRQHLPGRATRCGSRRSPSTSSIGGEGHPGGLLPLLRQGGQERLVDAR